MFMASYERILVYDRRGRLGRASADSVLRGALLGHHSSRTRKRNVLRGTLEEDINPHGHSQQR
jgi:hypothetical protein